MSYYKANWGGSRTQHVWILIVPLIFVISLFSTASKASTSNLQEVPFPAGTFVIPMDEKQVDVLSAFGFAHALLRNGTLIFRVIQPPDIVLITELFGSATFKGGPILIWAEHSQTVNKIKNSFPTVTLDNTRQYFVSDKVFAVEEPTTILIIKGNYNWGRTENLLLNMSIPYDIKKHSEVEANTAILDEYNLVIDDCSGWWHIELTEKVITKFQEFTERGGYLIFTDRAIPDAKKPFPDHFETKGSHEGFSSAKVMLHDEPPAQYSGPSEIDIYTGGLGTVIKVVTSKGRVLLYSQDYDLDYAILAAYFYYGKGVVELFAYHPAEQSSWANIYASMLYGNAFIGGRIALLKEPPPEPLPLALPPPPTPPPPPPPPTVLTAIALPAGFLFAGMIPLGLISVLKSKLRIKLKTKQKIGLKFK